jgi:hypothetical protein
MSDLHAGVALGDVLDPSRHDLPPSEQRVVRALIDEHVHVSCQLVPIDQDTWAIQGSIAVDGEVILAEFDNPEDAELALEQLAASEDDTTVR